jgi:MIP family channel proteins
MRRNELTSKSFWRAVFAEFVGTLLFVHIISGAILSSGNNLVVIAIAAGFSILILNYALSDISGAFFNPAITFAAALVGEISPLRALFYVIGEILGAVLGVVILYALFPSFLVDTIRFHFITTTLHNVSRAQGLFLETIMTFVIVFIVLMVDVNVYKRSLKKFSPIIIGFTVASLVLFAYSFTGASFNPARSFGAATVPNVWENHWIYWIGPLMGSLLATLFFKIFETHYHDLERSGEGLLTSKRDLESIVPPSAE